MGLSTLFAEDIRRDAAIMARCALGIPRVSRLILADGSGDSQGRRRESAMTRVSNQIAAVEIDVAAAESLQTM